MSNPVIALQEGINCLRVGVLDRAAHLFESAADATPSPAVRTEALRRLADVKRRRAQWSEALGLLEEALRIARAHALRDDVAAALNVAGTIHLQRGELHRAVEIYLEALGGEPSPKQAGLILQNLGTAFAQQGRHEEAILWYARSSAAFAAGGCRREQVLALINRGSVQLDRGDLPAAESSFRDALSGALGLPMGDAELQALAEINLAETLALQRTDLEEAYELTLRATGHFSAAENRPHRVACHRVFALITELQGHLELAIGALERGLDLARQIQSAPEIGYFTRELGRLAASPPVLVPPVQAG